MLVCSLRKKSFKWKYPSKYAIMKRVTVQRWRPILGIEVVLLALLVIEGRWIKTGEADRTFHNYRASICVDQQTLCGSETWIGGFGSSKVGKGLAGRDCSEYGTQWPEPAANKVSGSLGRWKKEPTRSSLASFSKTSANSSSYGTILLAVLHRLRSTLLLLLLLLLHVCAWWVPLYVIVPNLSWGNNDIGMVCSARPIRPGW